jgi:hypothetical protein
VSASAGTGANIATAGSMAMPMMMPVASGPAGVGGTAPSMMGSSGTSSSTQNAPADAGIAFKPSGLPDVTFTMDLNVPAGVEFLKCIYAAVPSNRGVIAVPSAESHYTPGSHHMLAYRTDLTSIPSSQTGVFDCEDGSFSQDGSWMQHNRGSYYEAQQPDSRRDLPEGVAHKFQPGEVVIIQSHYVNTTAKDIAAHIVFTLHTMDPAMVKYEASTILWSNLNINIAPHSKARVTMTCPIMADMIPALLWSHMHSRAVNFVATTDDSAAAAALGTLYTEKDWSEPQPREYPSNPPVTLHAGTNVTFSCDYQNDTDATFTYGNSAQTNEMCILHGMYYPKAEMGQGCFGGNATQTNL